MPLETPFEREFCKQLRAVDKDIITLKLDGRVGIPDRLILYKDKYCLLEFKRSENARKRPLQQFYIDKMGEYTYTNFVYPEKGHAVFREVLSFLGIPDTPFKYKKQG